MKRRNFLLSFLIATTILSLPKQSPGRVMMPTLEALTKNAKLIVIAQVEEVVTEQERRVASARVLDTWKGTAGERIQFRASKSWACDVSTASVGETVILFLVDDPNDSVMTINYYGIGRLPIENNNGESTVLLYSSLLTKRIKKLIGVPGETFRSNIGVALFKQQIRQIELEKTARAK